MQQKPRRSSSVLLMETFSHVDELSCALVGLYVIRSVSQLGL